MLNHYADDGRVLTPPKEVEPLLKDSFPTFSKIIGHIRFFYMADEIWDGKSSLVFNAEGSQLASFKLDDGVFYVNIGNENFQIVSEDLLDSVFEALKKNVPSERYRPFEHLTINPDEFPCGYRCDLCLGSKDYNGSELSKDNNFGYMNWVCYHNCVPNVDVDRFDGIFDCPGCKAIREDWKDCRHFTCPEEKGYANCLECGEYHSCDVYRDSHYAGQCNLGITAEEVTKLVIPYCMKERLDVSRDSKK